MAMGDNPKAFYQVGAEGFQPFNDAPAYLSGRVDATDTDGIRVHGHALHQANSWYYLGARSETLKPHSFTFSIDGKPRAALGVYSIGVQAVERGLSLSIAHYLRSSVSLREPQMVENIFSGWGYDSSGQRSQNGIVNPEAALNQIHRLELRYDSAACLLSASANGNRVHAVPGSLQPFRLLLRVQVIGAEGDFDIEFMNLSYSSFDTGGLENARALRAWDPQYSPVFISYAHADRERVPKIIDSLRAVPVRVLCDWDFKTGDSLLGRISEDIARAGYLIVMLSRASTATDWVSRELRLALAGEALSGRVKVLPAKIEDCTMPDFLGDRIWADFRNGDEDGLKRILEVIRTGGEW
jgi:hypothetical protein